MGDAAMPETRERVYTRSMLETTEWGTVPMLSLPDGVNDFVRDPEGNWWHLAPPSLRDWGAVSFSASHMADELDAALSAFDAAQEGDKDGR